MATRDVGARSVAEQVGPPFVVAVVADPEPLQRNGSGWTSQPKVLLLDLDGTLVDTRAGVEASWRWAANLLGVPYEALEPFIHGLPAPEALPRALPNLSRRTTAAIAERVLHHQATMDRRLALVPGARELLEQVDDGRWAVVTSGDRRLARANLRRAQVTEPPVLVTANDVRHGKPSPEPYFLAARLLGVEPAECLVVEDSPAGVASAKAAGMPVVALMTTHDRAMLAEADQVVTDLRDVKVTRLPGALHVRVES